MNDPSDRSGSNTGLVFAIAVLVLALPCCGGLALVGVALVGIRSVAQPAAPQTFVQPAPPQPPPVATPPAQPQPPLAVPSEGASEPAAPSSQ